MVRMVFSSVIVNDFNKKAPCGAFSLQGFFIRRPKRSLLVLFVVGGTLLWRVRVD
jgi:hypothetical protein